MKKICFPATFRGHLARQKLLLDQLEKEFEVLVFTPSKTSGPMSTFAIFCAIEFNNFLAKNKVDAVLIRGDRYEMLGLTMIAVYRGIKVIHLEGGDLSGVIDNKVRHAITNLSDYHFVTNLESYTRLVAMGLDPRTIWNFGSLDAEYAESVEPKRLIKEPYIVIAYHPIPGEASVEVTLGMTRFRESHELKFIVSNKDYGKKFGDEEYEADDFINLLRFADCLVGNSSSFLKEGSVLGTPVVNVGSRQDRRLKPRNVMDVDCVGLQISKAISYQMTNKFEPDNVYRQPKTSYYIAKKLKHIL